MQRLLSCLALLLGTAFLHAQVPAQPADPNQPIPAQPVEVPAPAPRAVPVSPVGVPAIAAPAPTPPTTTGPAVPSIAIIADSSLKAVLQELAQGWADSQDSSPQVPLTLTNAGTMRGKIEAGAVWDVVISADIGDVKAMTDRGFLLASNQRSLARNSIVIDGRSPLVREDELEWFDMVGDEWKKVALGNPDLVASGRVARRALQRHDLLGDEHKNDFVYAPTETAALQMAQKQQADAVFVYRTDLLAGNLPGFEVFPLKTEDAPPIFYTAAIFRLAHNPQLAQSFVNYIGSEATRAIWIKYGFETN